MGIIKIKKGLDIPIKGKPDNSKIIEKSVKSVALLGADFNGLKPTIEVETGDIVKKGQILFFDKKNPAVKFTSPVSGKITVINRGEKRAFISLVINIEGNDEITFNSFSKETIEKADAKEIKEQLLDSGLWTSFRTRPFSAIPNPETKPNSIFINAMDTNPLAPSISKIAEGKEKEIEAGLIVLSKLTDGKLYFCKSPSDKFSFNKIQKLSIEEFDGPHPAGLSGTHIHFLDPVGKTKTVWHILLEDVINIGHLFLTGKLNNEKIISLAGTGVKNPKLIKTVSGAAINEIIEGELNNGEYRVISGSVLNGYKATGEVAFLGRYHRQISVIAEDTEKVFLGWLSPGTSKFSLKNVVLSKLTSSKIEITTALNGGHRAIVPIGSFEQVMPLDIIPTYLLRALAVNDVEEAEKLGCLELDEEDLALCTFVDPSKNDFGPILRNNLNIIEKEG